ncbi:MAG: hypothetical protein U9O53_02415 [archaeon]|nr:hypothetical protein [archaeon]
MISFKEEYLKAMYDGLKLHEFRRRFSKVGYEFYSLIYVSSPVSAVTAIIKFDSVIYGDIEKMIRLRQSHKFSSDDNLRAYFEDLNMGYALPVLSVKMLDEPVDLKTLRQLIPGFLPPQSYFRIGDKYSKIVEYVKEVNNIGNEII